MFGFIVGQSFHVIEAGELCFNLMAQFTHKIITRWLF